jgi:creatinine amidohydrolase
VGFVQLADLTWPAVERLCADGEAIGLVPTGALEQHGPHLPLGTDTRIAEALAREAAERVREPVLVTPVVHAGRSDHHTAFPGTVSVPERAFHETVAAHVEGLERAGVRRVALISAHGGNFGAIGEVAASWPARGSETAVVAYDDLWRLVDVMMAAGRAAGLDPPETDIHAGVLESSLALALFPAGLVVDVDGASGYTAAEPGWIERLLADGVRAVSDNGVLGRPAGASAEAGRDVLAALADEIADWLVASLDVHRADGR